MSTTGYYELLKCLFAASPPSGGATKSGPSGNKKAVSKSKRNTTVKGKKMKMTSRKSTSGKVKEKTAKKAIVKKTTVKAAKRTVTKKTPATVAGKKAAKKVVAVKASARTTTAKPKAAEARTISSTATHKTTTAKPKTTTRKRTAADKKTSVQRLVVRRSLNKGLENLKQRGEASKFFTPIQPVREERDIQELPREYGHCRLVCMVRDPYWVHSYWEITNDRLHEAESFFGEEWGETKTVLRVHDITGVDFSGFSNFIFFSN